MNGTRCRSLIAWFEVSETTLIGKYLVHEEMKNVHLIKDRLKTTQSCQNSFGNVRRRDYEYGI